MFQEFKGQMEARGCYLLLKSQIMDEFRNHDFAELVQRISSGKRIAEEYVIADE